MNPTLDTAIDAITRAGERKCRSQIYSFPDYDPYTHNYKDVCKRLGIRAKDDIILTYPAKSTFSTLDSSSIDTLETVLNANLPDDFRQLIERFGAFHLPGDAGIQIGSPDWILSYTLDGWDFDDPESVPMIAISPYSLDCDGDAIGFLRGDSRFGDELYRFRHDLRHEASSPTEWSTWLAPSIADFLVSYLE